MPAALLAAIAMHGVYDFFLFGIEALWWVSLLLALPAMAAGLALKVRWSRQRTTTYHPDLA